MIALHRLQAKGTLDADLMEMDTSSRIERPSIVAKFKESGHLSLFRSRWKSRIECSTDWFTLASESTESHEPVVGPGRILSEIASRGIIRICTVTSPTSIDVGSIAPIICRLDPSAPFEI